MWIDTLEDVVSLPRGLHMISDDKCKIVIGGSYMRIADDLLKSVGFIGEAISLSECDPHATGFFVSVPLAVKSRHRLLFFVTAKHVAQDLNKKNICVSVNKKNGGIGSLAPYGNKWWQHPTDETADIAVVPCNTDDANDIAAIPIERFVSQKMIDGGVIGLGDEVFTAGLFTPAPGQKRTLPIIRTGNVAMLPSEQIQTELGYADVYLVEARSIGGLSGSPVFVRETVGIEVEIEGRSQSESMVSGLGSMYFLGAMHGHWDIRESEMNNSDIRHDAKRGVNLGIGIVVPASKIKETLEQEGIKQLLDGLKKQIDRANIPGMDRSKPIAQEDTVGSESFTREDFEAALKKVSRKTEPGK